MLHLTLVCCADLGRLYCDNFEFDKASYSYTKAIKLSVYLGNKLKEEQYMDRLGMCQYYKGDSIGALYYHNKLGKLSTYDVNTIKELYSNEEELELLLAERMKRMRMKES